VPASRVALAAAMGPEAMTNPGQSSPIVPQGPPKLCRGCGTVKPRAAFYARRTQWGVYAQSRCKECARTRPENASYGRRYRTRVFADPEAAAVYRDKQRERARRQRGTPPARYRTGGPSATAGGLLPAGPFAQWLATLGDGPTAIGLACGLDPRQVDKYLNGSRDVLLDVVDRALLKAHTATTLNDLYPIEDEGNDA